MVVLALCLTLAACGTGASGGPFSDSSTGAPAPTTAEDCTPRQEGGGPYSPEELGTVGDCLCQAEEQVWLVRCESRHDSEVTALVTYGEEFADGAPMQIFDDCDTAFADYVGVPPPVGGQAEDPQVLYPSVFMPGEELWAEGRRTVACVVTSEEPWAGPVRGLGS